MEQGLFSHHVGRGVRGLLLASLQMAVDVAARRLGVEISPNNLELQAIPLRLVSDAEPLLYVSAIAPKLSRSWNRPVREIALAIASISLQNFTIKVNRGGWIYFCLNDAGIADWLQQRVNQGVGEGERGGVGEGFECSNQNSKLITQNSKLITQNSKLFPVQYAHARCCSLLRMAVREGMVRLNAANGEIEWIDPNPIPWLDGDQKLRLRDPAERSLIIGLFALLDDLYSPGGERAIDWEKTAITLSQEFEIFYRRCRIWGEVKRENPSLAQARLGLVMVTRLLVRILLQDLLGVAAPLEL